MYQNKDDIGVGFEQKQDERFLVLKKLIDFDTYETPDEIINICSKYLRKYRQMSYSFTQAVHLLFVEANKQHLYDDPIDRMVNSMVNGSNYSNAFEETFVKYQIDKDFNKFRDMCELSISNVLKVLFDENTTIKVCKYDKLGETDGDYEIFQDELQFFGYIVTTYKSKDYFNFIKKNYKNVSIEYLRVMLFGAVIVQAHHKINPTDEMLYNWIEIRMEYYRRTLIENYGLLHDRLKLLFSYQVKEKVCTIDLIDDINLCNFTLQELLDRMDESISILSNMCVTAYDTTEEYYKKRKKEFDKLKHLDI